ncbi:hypothetical protein EON66_04045 [archaeon]|nr:MAG: hypothetical protein EON66_04045 [archaeon]
MRLARCAMVAMADGARCDWGVHVSHAPVFAVVHAIPPQPALSKRTDHCQQVVAYAGTWGNASARHGASPVVHRRAMRADAGGEPSQEGGGTGSAFAADCQRIVRVSGREI